MNGKKPKLTSAHMQVIREWDEARRKLGGVKTLANRLGVCETTILKAVRWARGGRKIYKRELA